MTSSSFSRTTRAVYADSLQVVMLGLTFVTVLVVGWILWFFFANIHLYATSQTAQLTREGTIRATFPAASVARIRLGQSAFFYFADQDGGVNMMRATVAHIDSDRNEVQLLPHVDAISYPHLQVGEKGQVEVVVEECSPASLVIQAAGLAPVSEHRKRGGKR
jgi:hypothetical protein